MKVEEIRAETATDTRITKRIEYGSLVRPAKTEVRIAVPHAGTEPEFCHIHLQSISGDISVEELRRLKVLLNSFDQI